MAQMGEARGRVLAGLVATILFTLAVTAAGAQAATLVGSDQVHSLIDTNSAGQAEAFKAVAAASGTFDTLNVYLDSTNTASTVQIGLYTNSASKPSTKIASCSITSPQTGWNSCSASGSVTSGTTYWTAILRPQSSSGTLKFRDTPGGAANSAYTTTSTSLTSLPTSFSAGSDWPNAPASMYASVTTAPPTASFGFSPSSPVTGQTVTFDGSASTCAATPCTYTWQDDGTDGPGGTNFPLGSSPSCQNGSCSILTSSFVDAGTKHARLTITDAESRTDTVEHDVVVTTDTTPPDTIIDSTPTDPTTSTSATFTFHATESSTFSCTLDGTPASCTSPVNYSSLAVGEHDFSVVATDAASNTDPTPATFSWTIDEPANCTTTVSSLTGVLTAIDGGSPGDTICLADGSYGTLSITANIAAPGITVRAEHAGDATLTGAELSGSRITLARFNIEGAVVIAAGASGMTIEHNLITDGYKGVDMLTSSTEINDTKIIGNKFVGPFGEDGIRANRYHDADSDGVGLLIEDNEFTNIRENGNHSDCLQTVWVGDHLVFRGNYLHDNRCQGFFVKDQATAVDTVTVENNLFLRNDADPEPGCGDPCGQPWSLHVFGPMTDFTLQNNTIWVPATGTAAALRDSGWSGSTVIDSNVISNVYSDTTSPFGTGYDSTNNVVGTSPTGTFPSTGFTVVSSPSFANPSVDDYRTNDGRGVDWEPADKHFGP